MSCLPCNSGVALLVLSQAFIHGTALEVQYVWLILAIVFLVMCDRWVDELFGLDAEGDSVAAVSMAQ